MNAFVVGLGPTNEASTEFDMIAMTGGASSQLLIWQERTLVDRALVDALHGAAMQVVAWTVDDPAEMRRLLEIGVDGICTNRPEIGRRTVDARAA